MIWRRNRRPERRRVTYAVATESDIRLAIYLSERTDGMAQIQKYRNLRGQINGPQFLSSLAAGAGLGLLAMITHMQGTAPQWAGDAAPYIAAIIGTLLTGLGFLKSGDKIQK